MKRKPRVLFNASVILAGLYSPSGASGILLSKVKRGEVIGVVSRLIFDEVVRHADKINKGEGRITKELSEIFRDVAYPPTRRIVEKYYSRVTDPGDAHVLASFEEQRCGVLVSLDKKHILVLQNKIKSIMIMSPGQLVRKMRRVTKGS